MGSIKICDRCGKEIRPRNILKSMNCVTKDCIRRGKAVDISVSQSLKKYGLIDKNYDLCYDCFIELKNWLEDFERRDWMKPSIGRTVYCIYGDSILVEKVGYVGIASFIIENHWDCLETDSVEWFYNDYGIEWFTSLAKAKNVLITRYCEECKACKPKIEKAGINWYEIECCY